MSKLPAQAIMVGESRGHLLVFEPGSRGHHLPWLAYLCEDLLAAGFNLTVVADLRPGRRQLVRDHLGELAGKVELVSAFGPERAFRGGSRLAALTLCLRESGAEQVFMPNFDDLASSWLRKAGLGILPPSALRGRLSGIYFRPRFLAAPGWPPGNLLKGLGFGRLSRAGWFNHLFLLDEYLLDVARQRFPATGFSFLPDTWSGDFSHARDAARGKLGVPENRRVLLHYGLGNRRKGLHLVVRALADPGLRDSGLFLLCAGVLAEDREIRRGVAELVAQGRGRLLDRHVSQAEEELCFAAADAVLLPYVDHFGSSGVLSRAAAAGRPVIASDEGLLGRRVREHGLGLLFASGRSVSLVAALRRLAALGPEELQRYQEAGHGYARTCDRQSFRRALLAPLTGRGDGREARS